MASTTQPLRSDETGADKAADWSFARSPFWLFSHGFALAVIVLFVFLGLWQLDRHRQRQDENQLIEQRLSAAEQVVDGLDDLDGSPSDLDYRPVTVAGSWVDGTVALVANRSQGGVAGVHIVGVVELDDGGLLAVNRGFLPTGIDDIEPAAVDGPVRLAGWLRPSVERGRFGATDSGDSPLIPRLDTDSISERVDGSVPEVWLQVADDDPDRVTFPDPIPAPELDPGPHLGYAAQWFIFATLGALFYGALLRRQSRAT